jgi:GNAT superfamily N-acetyltransferase
MVRPHDPTMPKSSRSIISGSLGREHVRLDPETVLAGVTAVLADASKGEYSSPSPMVNVGQCRLRTNGVLGNGNRWWFQSVYVDAPWRAQGVFRVLFEHVQEAARAAGVVALRLYVEGGNAPAQAAYRRRGMERTGYQVFELDLRDPVAWKLP